MFINLPSGGHLSRFQSLVIMNETAIKTCVWGFRGCMFLNYLSKYLGIGLPNPKLRLSSALKETAKVSSKVTIPLCIPSRNKWEFLLLYTLTSIWKCQLFVFSHSNRSLVVSHYSFNLYFPNDLWYWVSFQVLICYHYIFFGEVFVQFLCSLFANLTYFCV